MNALRRISVEELNKLAKKNDIWCIGCGKRFYDMLGDYAQEEFISRITTLVDNDIYIQGKGIAVAENKTLHIMSKDILRKMESEKCVLLITSDAAEKIFGSIEELVPLSVRIYLYPQFYRKTTSKWLAFFSRFTNGKRLLFYAGEEPHENADAIIKCIKEHYAEVRFKPVYLGDSPLETIKIAKEDVVQKGTIYRTLRYCFYYGTSKYLFYENEALQKVGSKQKLIYLNHGTIPLKRVNDVLRQKDDLDYAICPSEGCTTFYEEQYGVSKEKLRYAMPARTKALFDDIDILWKKCGEKLIVWLPTFRQLKECMRNDSETDSPFDVVGNVDGWNSLNKLLRMANTRLLIKKHPRDKLEVVTSQLFSNIQVITDQELNEQNISLLQLLGKTDALLTDYSGVAFEYMVLNRPIGYVIADIEKYHRGFSVNEPFHYMPGMKIKTLKELCDFLLRYEEKDHQYAKARKELVRELFGENAWENGAQKIIQLIIRKEI